MSYTENEILDLESSLGDVGLESKVSYKIIEPEEWDTKSPFWSAFMREVSEDLKEAGVTPIYTAVLRGKRSYRCISIGGPAVKMSLLVEKIKAKFEIKEVLRIVS